MIKRFFILLLAIVASVGMSYALTPQGDDTWDEGTKTMTINRQNVGDGEYAQNSDIEHLIISSSVETIGVEICVLCNNLIDATIGANVTSIGQYAFAACSSLTTVTCEATTPPSLDSNPFFQCDNLAHIYVPAASVATYKAAANWSAYESIISAAAGGSAPAYTVALQAGTANADKVTLSATSAVEGATITVTPNEEYEITAFSAYYVVVEDQVGSIYEIDATLDPATGAYSFTMPAFAVTIEATIAEKAAPAPATTVTWNSSNISDLQVNGNSYSKEGITLSPNASNNYAYWLDYGNESQNGIAFYVNATGGFTFSNSLGKNFTKIEMTLNGSTGWNVAYLGSGWNIDGMKAIWTGNASTVDLLTETSDFGGAATVKSIVFYFEGGSEDPAPANSCGGGLTWELNNGELVISYDGEGTGVMNDYDIPNDNPAPWYANRENITSVSLPEGIKTIGKDAFRNCVNLTTVTIPNSVTTIGESAFVTVEHLETVTIGTGITSIVNGAFYGNAELTTVTCSATTPPSIGMMVFGSCTNLEHIYVPAESVDAYKTAWSDYASLIEAIGGGSAPVVNLKLIEFQVPASWENDNTPISSADFPDFVATTYEIASALPVTSEPSLVVFDFPGDDEVSVYSKMGGQVSKASTGAIKREAFFENTQVHYYYPVLAGGGSTDVIPCTAADLGKVLCTDGSIYTTVSDATAAGKTAAAVIAYVDTENGKALALALADDGDEMNWATAKTTAAAHTPAVSGGTWTLASKDDWNNMITAAGSYTALRDGFSGVGGTNMNEDKYWSSTPENDNAWCYYFNYGKWIDGYVDNPCRVRACLAFDIPAAPAYETVMNLIDAIGTVELTAECKAKIDAARTAYDALSDGDKAQVTNIATLTTAEAAFENVMNIWLSGDCDVILWKDTTLTVKKHAGEGNGAMADYNYASRAPWYSGHWYNPQPNDIVIKSVTIEEGVTHLGDYAFAWMSEMKTATIPSSVTTIPEDAFYWSKAVDDIYFTADPSNLTWALPNTADVQFKPEKATRCHVPADLLTAYQEKFGTLNMTFVGDLDPITPLTPEQQQALDAAKGLINAIPSPVVYTPACKDAIDAARAAYDALTPDMLKQLVSNYATLTAAEATYESLKDVAVVEAKINEIPSPMTEADLTLSIYDKVTGAREAYDALTADQQALVPAAVLTKLTDAEAAFAAIGGGGGVTTVVVIYKSEFTSTGVTKEGVNLALSNGSMTADDMLAMDGSFEFSTSLGKFTNITIETDVNIMNISEGAFTSAGWPTGTNLGTSAAWTGNSESVLIDCMVAGNAITITCTVAPASPLADAQAVKDLIDAIPVPVTLDDACVNAVQAARDAYDALSEAAQGALDDATVQKLNQAIADYTALIQAGADAVITKINNIPQPVTLKLATRDSIESARAAYDALTADQQALVSNYQILLDAEATMATLNPGGGAPDGTVSGKFSIDESSVVYFSKGNLQATTADLGANWTWGFAANQWNTIGNVAANNAISGNGTVSANGTVDLFGWSTSTTKYGIHNGTNSNISDYAGDFKDWGTTMGDGWFTLSKEQWHCLLNTRTGDKAATVNSVADCRYTKATINTDGTAVKGMILFPDGGTFAASEFTEVGSPNAEDVDYTTTCTTAQWNALQAKGCVFLPAAGRRYGADVSTEDPNGYYWSSSPKPSTDDAYYMFFYSYGMYAPNDFRCLGLSVRLVTEAPASPLDSAQAVKDLIETIPAEITLDAACVNAVQAARDAYNALTEATKGALDAATVNKLNQAITDYTALIQAGADAVTAKIAAIPQPVTLKLATRDSIESARAAYDALTADQKLLVSNYDVLTAAEATWAGLINVAPAGALSGKYTINDGGDVIYFAHGNLQYTRENLDADWSTGTFRLAENQYDLIEADPTYPAAYCTDNYGDKTAVGLFGWGTWGEGKTPNLTSSDRNLYTWSTDFSGTLEGTDTWRTLTKDEWVYLLAHSNQSYATVHGVNGLLVAPDSKDIEGKSMTDWVEINDETWTTMQNDGYLFLPACGQRSQMSATANITTGDQGEDVVYYSSTQNTDATAYNIWYKPGSQKADDYSNKRQAFGVRLVSAGVNPLDQVQVVKGLIDAIPAEITLDDACVNAIQSARAGYDALDTDAKAILDAADVQKLTDAEAALTALNQAEADKVIAKINNIPTPVELKLATRDSIESARTAYDALNAAQQALVTNYQTLLDAETALAELNKGGSASVDIVWDINTGIESVATNTTSPAYDGITITTGNGNRFYQTTQDPIMLRFFFTGGKGRYAFAKEDGTHFTKVALISSVAMGEWLRDPSRIGTDWVVSDDYKKATWIGDADTVKIWDGAGATAWVDVDSIVFTVNASATPLDSAQVVKGQIEAIRETLDPTEACGAEIAAALDAYDALSDAAKGALDAADVQKLNDAATQYPALVAIAAIEAIPDEITYDPMTKSYIENAKAKYDELSDASKALVNTEDVQKLTNALEAWAILAAKIEHNVSYIGKDGELKNEKVALLHIPDPAPDFNGYEFVRWDVKAGDFLEEGLRVKAVYTPIITTNPAAYDTLVYNGTAQELVVAGVAKEGHIEYRINDGEWSAELPKATFAAAYEVSYKLVREGHADYLAGSIVATIAKAPVTYTAPTAVETLVYNASNQTLIAAGQTSDGTFEYTLAPNDEESWNTELPQAKDAGTYSVYYRVQGDLNHLDSTAVDPIAVTIAKAELTATADDKAIIFGELAPQFTVTYAGWQGDDDASDLTGDIAYATPYVRGNNVGEYTITPSGVDAANYTITFVNGTLTVNRKSAESSDITAVQAEGEQLVYTNAVNKPTILVKDTTLMLTEEKDYTLTFVGRGETEYTESATAPTHVGEYTAIVAFVGNYKDTLTVDFAIAKAPLTITADDKENIFGEEAPEFTVSYEGFLGTDTKDVLTGSQAYACEYKRGDNVGDYTIVPSGVDAHDYVITFVNGTLTVNRKSAKDADIVAAQLAGEALVYDAEANRPSIVVTDTTLTLTEEKDYVLTFIGTANDASVYEESAVAPTKAGDYTAIVAFVGNYIDTLTVDFTVSKAPLTITADDKEMIYGDEHPEFTVSYDGFLGTDDNSVLLGTQGYNCSYAPGSYIGTYAITPKDVEAYDYAITFVDGTLTVNKAVVSISGAEAQCAKFADGNAQAVVLQQGTLNGIKLNDPIAHVTTAAYSSADVAEHLTVTLFYELTGDAALLTNYDLQPTSEVFSTEGVIIEPMIPDDQPAEKEDEETEVKEGIEVYAYGYCDGSGYSLRYHLETGIPDQYKIEFADSRFADVDWTKLEVKGPDGHIDILIPVDLPTGDYTMTVTFRDSRFTWLESKPFDVTFHVNLPETFITPLFNNTIALVDTCNCFTDIQWYWRADDTQLWQPIEGATGHYYHVEGKLTGEYFVQARMNGEPTYTCGQADMETLYGAEKQQPKATVKAFPNPVVNTTTVTIENSENWNHSLRVVNLTGVEMFRTTFEGNETVVRMDGFVQGNYMISVDGIVVKVMKQ